MNLRRWLARRDPNWQALAQLLTQAEKKGLKSLSGADINQLASLYRSTSADLARAKTGNLGQPLILELQQLTTRAYSQIYQGSRHQEWQAVGDFYRWSLPEVIRATLPYTAIAFAIFLLGTLIAVWFGQHDPSFLAVIVPEELITKVRDEQELWMGSILGVEPVASSSIMVNNLTVSFRVVAGGITAGLWTVYALFYNGILIGAIAALVGQHQLAFPFWAFVFPHGALELPAIFFAGGGGLLIAQALLWPGRYPRITALKQNSLQAAQLLFGVIPLLIIAGLIEGFISPSPLVPSILKYLLGTGIFGLLVVYCWRSDPSLK